MTQEEIPRTDAEKGIKKPRLVLRVGFAGTQAPDPAALPGIRKRLDAVLSCIGEQLVELAPDTPCRGDQPPEISKYYAPEHPLLRVISGLCEGGDQLAYEALERVKVPRDEEGQPFDCLDTENGLIIGFDRDSYRASRKAGFHTEFDRQIEKAAYLLEADGAHRSGEEAKRKRGRAYRCQSDLLLRQSDLLIALVDLESEGGAGGTMETVRKALPFQLPVVLLPTKMDKVLVLDPASNLSEELAGLETDSTKDWHQDLTDRVERIIADPQISDDALDDEQSSHGRDVLDEFFSDEPIKEPRSTGWWPSWSWFEGLFTRPKKVKASKDTVSSGNDQKTALGHQRLVNYRKRASDLSAFYATRYRNGFLRNALFGFAAVLIATASLVILAIFYEHPPVVLLIALALVKLYLVFIIYRGTHQANHEHWNDRAVDYRYLSERLRSMLYLPAAGIWQPPAAQPPQYASRVIRQSAVDWLFDAIVRGVSPGEWADAEGRIRLEPEKALRKIRFEWLGGQWGYHHGLAWKMRCMERSLRTLGEVLNGAVMVLVTFDILLLILKLSHVWSDEVKVIAPYVVALTALLPAFVAALNVIRSQSESERLSERSAVLIRLLGGLPPEEVQRAGSHKAHGGWLERVRMVFDPHDKKGLEVACHADPSEIGERGKIRVADALLEKLATEEEAALEAKAGQVLHFAEDCAEVFVQEVAEWSVLYAKEMVET